MEQNVKDLILPGFPWSTFRGNSEGNLHVPHLRIWPLKDDWLTSR